MTVNEPLMLDKFQYPSDKFLKNVYRLPIVLYRMGMGKLFGRLFMIITTVGRKSGLPRRTAIEFHQHKGRKYVTVGWAKSDWYQNILANPAITIQTAAGVEHVRARRITSDEELNEAWEVAERSFVIQTLMKMTGSTMTRESFLAQKDNIIILTFDPTDEPTPPALEADLRWIPSAVFNIMMTIMIRRWIKARREQRKQRKALTAHNVTHHKRRERRPLVSAK